MCKPILKMFRTNSIENNIVEIKSKYPKSKMKIESFNKQQLQKTNSLILIPCFRSKDVYVRFQFRFMLVLHILKCVKISIYFKYF